MEDGQDVSPGTSGGDGMLLRPSSSSTPARWHPCRLHDLAPSPAENVVARRSCGGELGALLGVLEEGRTTPVGGPPRLHSHNVPVVPRGTGAQAQPKVDRVAERAVAQRDGGVDGQGGEPDGGRSRGAAQQTGFVLLCALQKSTPIMERGKSPQAAGGGGVRRVFPGFW